MKSNIYMGISGLIIISILLLMYSIDYMTRLAILIFIFILSGLIYKILDFKFLGLTYIIVYVGAISILFLFVIKKTEAGRTPNLMVKPGIKKELNKNEEGARIDILVIKTFLSIGIGIKLKDVNIHIPKKDVDIYNIYKPDYTTNFINFTDIETLGILLYEENPMGMLIIGILLLATLIGILKISQNK